MFMDKCDLPYRPAWRSELNLMLVQNIDAEWMFGRGATNDECLGDRHCDFGVLEYQATLHAHRSCSDVSIDYSVQTGRLTINGSAKPA